MLDAPTEYPDWAMYIGVMLIALPCIGLLCGVMVWSVITDILDKDK